MLQKGYDIKRKERLIHTRQICWTVFKGWADPKAPDYPKTIQKYWPIAGEKEPNPAKINRKQLNKTLDFVKKLHKNV